jgi:hypothetical protein
MNDSQDNILLDREVVVFKSMDNPHLVSCDVLLHKSHVMVWQCKIEAIFCVDRILYLILPLMDRNTPNEDPDLISYLSNSNLRGGEFMPEKDTATLLHHVAVAIK